MLVLSRKPNESIMIGNDVEVKIVEVKGDYVKLGITAPKAIPVHRKEIYEAIQRENIQATKTSITDLAQLDDIFKKKEIKHKDNNKK
ncbi:MAG: carbon storage regulator CsrA [Candidatus Omnitrophica bacterium]|nr:carbon storage regulator CsrA [Candidatus Omnitrophota bacterium]